MEKESYSGMRVLVMGLGLNGGGMESARYLASRGAEVTVTDLRDENTLAPSIEKLKDSPVRYVLGRHEMEDFINAHMVIKNPGVKPDSPFLLKAKRIETDISLFLAACPARLLAVTGSKGKSSTSAALHWALNEARTLAGLSGKAYLGGNIALSPLSFLDELEEGDDVVLELSSWQLGDIRGKPLLKPRAAIITPIMRDHLDRYGTMEAYVADKRLIYQNQDENDVTIARDDNWGNSFLSESRGRPLVYSGMPLSEGISGGWIPEPESAGFARLWEIPGCEKGKVVEVVPERLLVPGFHQKQNILAVALALLDLGLKPDFIRESLGRFPGIEHRLEFIHESGGVKFYNDSAATIPEAAAAAITAFEKPPVLVTGGTDKELDFSPLAAAAVNAKALILLAGTGSEKLKRLLDERRVKYRGPFDSLDAAINAALETAVPGDSVILSPGCTSFGMFLNEFDRGNKWKEGVRKLFSV
ncbi:MAG: UDP-N-acetylmuramoyl-L-alanine--D-glutamate ligase [Treponema sp.]|jgi:UDP-N-acetylmuramoylalanine--D-glutamate ligase|nr:UDP-N-acetylmuramoyl-L-alanine--D-glutamate ligase [Treponema sp.]